MLEGIKKKRGRPMKEGARRKRVVFSCNDKEREIIERAARLNNLSLSEYIRTRIYNDSVDYIDKRKAALSDMYGSGEDGYEYDEYYEDEPEDENYI